MKEVDRADERPDVVMTVADKDAINSFSRLLARRSELLATAKVRFAICRIRGERGMRCVSAILTRVSWNVCVEERKAAAVIRGRVR